VQTLKQMTTRQGISSAEFNDEKVYWTLLKMPSDPMIVAVLQALLDQNLNA
jgi:hypothetical protein